MSESPPNISCEFSAGSASWHLPYDNIAEARLDLERYCRQQVAELKLICSNGTLLPAVCLATFTEYLANLAFNKSSGRQFANFVRQFMPKYAAFEYVAGDANTRDLPEQMWHVFRCGLVHNMSLAPSPVGKFKVCPLCEQEQPMPSSPTARANSIVLTHRRSNGPKHLDRRTERDPSGVLTLNAAVFILEDYADDLDQAITTMFDRDHHQNSSNTVNWDKANPRVQ